MGETLESVGSPPTVQMGQNQKRTISQRLFSLVGVFGQEGKPAFQDTAWPRSSKLYGIQQFNQQLKRKTGQEFKIYWVPTIKTTSGIACGGAGLLKGFELNVAKAELRLAEDVRSVLVHKCVSELLQWLGSTLIYALPCSFKDGVDF